MKMRSGFISFALRTPSAPFSAAAVLKPCFSRAFCMTNTSVGESSTIRISAILSSPSFADVSLDCAQQFIFGERLGQVVFRTHDSTSGAIEQSILARQHDHGNLFENLVVLDERTGLIPIQARHHDVHKHDVWLVVGDLGKSVESVDCRKYLATLLAEQGFCGTAYGLAVIDH